MGDKMALTEMSELFRESAEDKEARAQFAESFAVMINEVLPVETSVRNIFTVEQIPAGAVPVYTSDVQPISAWFLPKYGQAPTNIVEIEEVTVPTFEVTGKVEWKLRDAKHGRISVAERAMQRLMDSMLTMEEEAGWAVLKAACGVTNTFSLAGEEGFTKAVANEGFRMMRSNRDYQVTDIYLGVDAAADFRAWTDTDIDPVTQREIWVNAGLGNIWGANIHEVYFLGNDEAYFLDARPGKIGYMPIRDELKTWDNPTSIDKYRQGVVAYEEIGFVVMDSKAIVKASLTRTES